jgi:TonB family protein
VTSDRLSVAQRVRALVGRIDRQLRAHQRTVRVALVFFGVALLAVLAAAAWLVVTEVATEAADPRPAYVKNVQEKISKVTESALATARTRNLPASLKVRIEVDAEGNLTLAKVVESSGDPRLDELTLRIIRTAAPFGPFPAEMRRTTKVVELNSEFYFQ